MLHQTHYEAPTLPSFDTELQSSLEKHCTGVAANMVPMHARDFEGSSFQEEVLQKPDLIQVWFRSHISCAESLFWLMKLYFATHSALTGPWHTLPAQALLLTCKVKLARSNVGISVKMPGHFVVKQYDPAKIKAAIQLEDRFCFKLHALNPKP